MGTLGHNAYIGRVRFIALMSGSELRFLQTAITACDSNSRSCALPSSQAGGDWSGSGRVDFDDIPDFRQMAASNGLGEGAFEAGVARYLSAPPAVPEPATGTLFLCFSALLASFRSSRREYRLS